MGIHYNHKSKAGDRKMEKQLKLKMKAEARKQKRLEKEAEEQEEEMRKLEELTRPDNGPIENKQLKKLIISWMILPNKSF